VLVLPRGRWGGGDTEQQQIAKKNGASAKKKKNEIENGCWEKKKWKGSPDDLHRKGIPDGDTSKGTTQFKQMMPLGMITAKFVQVMPGG
jgi:hypothetical protein